MFWRLGFRHQSPIDIMLDRKNITPEELLAQDELIQELKVGNEKLLAYLVQDPVLSRLITLATSMPPENVEEARLYKVPNAACDILCSDYGERLCRAVLSSPTHIATVMAALEAPAPLHPILGYYFFRLVQAMLHLDIVSFLTNFKTLPPDKYVPMLLSHLHTSYIPEVVLGLQGGGAVYEAARIQNPTIYRDVAGLHIAEWWLQGRFPNRCIDVLHGPKERVSDEDRSMIVQVMMEPLRRWGYIHVTVLSDVLLSSEFIDGVLRVLLDETTSPGLVCDVLEYATVAIEMAAMREMMTTVPETTPQDGEDPQPQKKSPKFDLCQPGTVIDTLRGYVPRLLAWLRPDSSEPSLNLPGMVIPIRAGNRRVRILELILCMVRVRKQCLDDALVASDAFRCCLEALGTFHNNNFVHCLVSDIFVNAMKQTESEGLRQHVLGLHQDVLQMSSQKPRLQNFGHLLLVLHEMISRVPQLTAEGAPWAAFIKDVIQPQFTLQNNPLIGNDDHQGMVVRSGSSEPILLGPVPQDAMRGVRKAEPKPPAVTGPQRYMVDQQDDDDEDFTVERGGLGQFDASDVLDGVVYGDNLNDDDTDMVWEERVLIDADTPQLEEGPVLSPTLPPDPPGPLLHGPLPHPSSPKGQLFNSFDYWKI
jgi:hypothetical protein